MADVDEPKTGGERRFLIVTGLSGAGKSQALRSLEDMGYFCVDNLPPALMPRFAEIVLDPAGNVNRVAVVVDVRGGSFFKETVWALGELDRMGVPYEIVYLEASPDVLLRRFKETRRRHPLAPLGRVTEGLQEEAVRLEGLRGRAHHVIDTSNLSPLQLRRLLADRFGDEPERLLVYLVSFGFKHGLPLDADLVFDVRFLRNPHYVPSLQPLGGDEEPVRQYVLRRPASRQFLRRAWSLLRFLLPHYVREGKTQLTIAVGCTGGQHRSVVLVDVLAERLRAEGYKVYVQHRDLPRWREEAAAAAGEEEAW